MILHQCAQWWRKCALIHILYLTRKRLRAAKSIVAFTFTLCSQSVWSGTKFMSRVKNIRISIDKLVHGVQEEVETVQVQPVKSASCPDLWPSLTRDEWLELAWRSSPWAAPRCAVNLDLKELHRGYSHLLPTDACPYFQIEKHTRC